MEEEAEGGDPGAWCVFGDLEAEGEACVSVVARVLVVDGGVVLLGDEGDVEPRCDAGVDEVDELLREDGEFGFDFAVGVVDAVDGADEEVRFDDALTGRDVFIEVSEGCAE